jgi:alpha-glucosidase
MLALHKIPHPKNFVFASRVSGGEARCEEGDVLFSAELEDWGEDVFRLTARTSVASGPRLAHVVWSGAVASTYRAEFGPSGELRLSPREGTDGPSLGGRAGDSLGVCGAAWMLRLTSDAKDRFFGMGEKWGRLEKSGLKTQFWNTDVWADYAPEVIGRAEIDACYVSIPYLIVERAGVFFGILLDTGERAFMATNPVLSLTGEDPFGDPGQNVAAQTPAGQLFLGAMGGPVSVYFLVGPSLRELTRKLQRLVGTTPRPPLWALGHHQSRWGYGDRDDLLELDQKFAEHGIPCDGLWLDIDYMDGFRVFTTRSDALPEKNGRFDWGPLEARRRRVVPILDPGVKVDPGYRIYDSGLRGSHFCLGPTGRPYVGIVWPGDVHFPDFSRAETRAFWAHEVSTLARKGFDAFWIDMNDPSTGPVDAEQMLFDGGRLPHSAFHNEYALGMAQATRAGLLAARPHERPFVLTRSASLGIGREAAVWTGDNVSSFRHLAAALPTSVNLALSGVPFNGPDVPGFGGDATDELAIRFYQAAFLFPFLRNHSVKGSRRQEPWAFEGKTLRILRQLIRLRYRFLPYLYQLFVEQEHTGEPILAPAFIDQTSQPDFHTREAEFQIGRLYLAPVVEEGARQLSLRLPAGDWFCLRTGEWQKGERISEVRVPLGETPLYVRSGTLLPIAPKDTVTAPDGGAPIGDQLIRQFDVHVFLRNGQSAELRYVQDDGASLAYKDGAERTVVFRAERQGKTVTVRRSAVPRRGVAKDLPPLRVRWVLHGGVTRLEDEQGPVAVRPARERMTGGRIDVLVSEPFVVE